MIFQTIGPKHCSEPMIVGSMGHMRLSTQYAESQHLGLSSLLYSQFTTVVAASWANSVVDVVCATVWAKCQCWHFCFVMSTTLRLSGVRLSSFWMCHNFLLFNVLFLIIIQPSIPQQATQNCLSQYLLPSYIILHPPYRCRGGLGEVHPSLDCNHHLGDYAPTEDSL